MVGYPSERQLGFLLE